MGRAQAPSTWTGARDSGNASVETASSSRTMVFFMAVPSTEVGWTAFAQRGDAFLHVGPGKAHEFERQRGVETRPRLAQPVVQRVLGPADGGLAAARQPVGDLVGLGQQLLA